MGSNLGVSVGASAVRLAYPNGENADAGLRWRVVRTDGSRPEELAAETVGTLLTERSGDDPPPAVAVAYRDREQAGAVWAALARHQLHHVQLVPGQTAALRMLEQTGALGDHATLVLYDLGSSGLTITVLDRSTAMVLSRARTDEISGDLVDELIRDHQLDQHRVDEPADAAAQRALGDRCREVKERLSDHWSVCVPGDGGLLLMSQDVLESLITGPVEASARLTGEVVGRSGRVPDAVVLIGGGARIPLIRTVIQARLNLPVIVPDHPERVAAEGAALLAEPYPAPRQPDPEPATDPLPAVPGKPRRSAPANGAMAAVTVIGLGLGLGLMTALHDTPDETTPVPTAPSPETPPPPETTPPTAAVPAEPPRATVSVPTAAVSVPDSRDSESDMNAPVPAGPAPAGPGPLIPGLPQIQLPPLPAPPPLPRMPWPP
ncbi:Hsp70 family protein [Rhodococcus koreensis]